MNQRHHQLHCLASRRRSHQSHRERLLGHVGEQLPVFRIDGRGGASVSSPVSVMSFGSAQHKHTQHSDRGVWS